LTGVKTLTSLFPILVSVDGRQGKVVDQESQRKTGMILNMGTGGISGRKNRKMGKNEKGRKG
jgi:hypothetical protein